MEASHSHITEQLLEPVALERAGAAGQVPGEIDDPKCFVYDERATGEKPHGQSS
jgi:hypothetical protein